jgi:TolB-like protein
VRRRSALVLVHLLVPLLGPLFLAGSAGAIVIALFPIQNSAGDSAAAATADQILRFELSNYGSLVGPERTRDALRRLRLRNGDHAAPALLRLLGKELAADWLVSVSLHDTERRAVPRLTMSLRIYSSATGELLWMDFRGASGIDRRKLLGLGTIDEMDELIPFAVRDLLEELPTSTETSLPTGTQDDLESSLTLGKVAVVPFDGSTKQWATRNAETVTEAVRAQLFRSGVVLVSPNLSHEILRQQQSGRWEGVTARTWTALHADAGADTILTGEVETYEVGGSESEPRPRVALAMRLLDARTGRILWTGSLERTGWDGQGLLGLGRIRSRGALTVRMTEILAARLEREMSKDLRD